MKRVRAMRAMKILVTVALIMAVATPALANWQSLGWAFFGLAAFNSLAAAARPYPGYSGYYPGPAYYPAYGPSYGYYGYYRPYGFYRPYGYGGYYGGGYGYYRHGYYRRY